MPETSYMRALMCCGMSAGDCGGGRRLPSSTKGIVNTQLSILWMCGLMSSHIVMYNLLPSLTFYEVIRATYCPLSSTFPGSVFIFSSPLSSSFLNPEEDRSDLKDSHPGNRPPFYSVPIVEVLLCRSSGSDDTGGMLSYFYNRKVAPPFVARPLCLLFMSDMSWKPHQGIVNVAAERLKNTFL